MKQYGFKYYYRKEKGGDPIYDYGFCMAKDDADSLNNAEIAMLRQSKKYNWYACKVVSVKRIDN